MDLELHWLDQPLTWLYWTGLHVTGWKLIGYTGALMFGGRWLVQLVASKRAGKPVIPRLFWYMSVVGSLMTLSVHRVVQPAAGHQASRLEAGQGQSLTPW